VAEEVVQNICGRKGNFNDLWRLIHSLCSLGLTGLVEPVLDTIKLDSPAWLAQRAQILEQARKLPSGTVSWESRAQIFDGNITALSIASPTLEKLRSFWQEHQHRYGLYCANDGNFQVVDQQDPLIFSGFIGGLIDHRALTRFWTYKCVGYQLPRPIAFDGAGYGWVLVRVLESTERTLHNFSTAVYIVEPDPVSACILLNLQDLRPWQNRIRMFAGPDALREFEDALKTHRHWDIPGTMVGEQINLRPALNLQATVAAAAQKRTQEDAALAAEVAAHYSAIPIATWAARFEEANAGKHRLKVLGMTSRYTTVLQYSMDELGEAIRAAGHDFVLCKEPDDQSSNVPEVQIIAEHKPDLLVMISRLRSENPRLPKNMPALCWDQDNLPCMRTDAARNGLDAFTYVAGAGARIGYEQLGWPRENCILAFLAAATHRYHYGPVSEELLARHRCTFSYASNASVSPEALTAELRLNYAGDHRAAEIFDRAAQTILARSKAGFAWDSKEVAQLVDSCGDESAYEKSELAMAGRAEIRPLTQENRGLPPSTKKDDPTDASHARSEGDSLMSATVRQEMILHLRTISDRAFRHVALGWVVEYCEKNKTTLRLYGKGWESTPRFAPYAAGFLAPGEEMRAVYRASDINLQIIETGFLHSRALDGLAAGGFFLNRLAPGARDIDQTEKARLIMARRAIETGCVTYAQLDASTDPLITRGWAYARSVIPLGKPHDRCRMLDIWEAAPSEEAQCPHLNEITFESQEQFNQLADQYLAGPDLRARMAQQLRQVVVERFSYDARWKQFLSGIASGLRQSADAITAGQTKAA
jgi:hypothetical protein